MGKIDHQRPRFRIAGRQSESIDGLSFGITGARRKPAPPKADLRAAGVDAVAAFMARGGKVTKGPAPVVPERGKPAAKPALVQSTAVSTSTEKPPWE